MTGQRPLKVGDLVDVAFRGRLTDANDPDWVMCRPDGTTAQSYVLVSSCTLVDPPVQVGTVVTDPEVLDRLPDRALVMAYDGWVIAQRILGEWLAVRSGGPDLQPGAAWTSKQVTPADIAAWDRPTIMFLPTEAAS